LLKDSTFVVIFSGGSDWESVLGRHSQVIASSMQNVFLKAKLKE
jgi:hypothetical protein